MTKILTAKWIKSRLTHLRSIMRNWEGHWRRETINPLLYVRHDFLAHSVSVHRKRDNVMLLSMNDEGRVQHFHHGSCSAEEAIAIGEALIILGLGYRQSNKRHEAIFD